MLWEHFLVEAVEAETAIASCQVTGDQKRRGVLFAIDRIERIVPMP